MKRGNEKSPKTVASQVRERREHEALERQNNQEVKKSIQKHLSKFILKVSRELEESEGLQWGKPGPGGAYFLLVLFWSFLSYFLLAYVQVELTGAARPSPVRASLTRWVGAVRLTLGNVRRTRSTVRRTR